MLSSSVALNNCLESGSHLTVNWPMLPTRSPSYVTNTSAVNSPTPPLWKKQEQIGMRIKRNSTAARNDPTDLGKCHMLCDTETVKWEKLVCDNFPELSPFDHGRSPTVCKTESLSASTHYSAASLNLDANPPLAPSTSSSDGLKTTTFSPMPQLGTSSLLVRRLSRRANGMTRFQTQPNPDEVIYPLNISLLDPADAHGGILGQSRDNSECDESSEVAFTIRLHRNDPNAQFLRALALRTCQETERASNCLNNSCQSMSDYEPLTSTEQPNDQVQDDFKRPHVTDICTSTSTIVLSPTSSIDHDMAVCGAKSTNINDLDNTTRSEQSSSPSVDILSTHGPAALSSPGNFKKLLRDRYLSSQCISEKAVSAPTSPNVESTFSTPDEHSSEMQFCLPDRSRYKPTNSVPNFRRTEPWDFEPDFMDFSNNMVMSDELAAVETPNSILDTDLDPFNTGHIFNWILSEGKNFTPTSQTSERLGTKPSNTATADLPISHNPSNLPISPAAKLGNHLSNLASSILLDLERISYSSPVDHTIPSIFPSPSSLWCPFKLPPPESASYHAIPVTSATANTHLPPFHTTPRNWSALSPLVASSASSSTPSLPWFPLSTQSKSSNSPHSLPTIPHTTALNHRLKHTSTCGPSGIFVFPPTSPLKNIELSASGDTPSSSSSSSADTGSGRLSVSSSSASSAPSQFNHPHHRPNPSSLASLFLPSVIDVDTCLSAGLNSYSAFHMVADGTNHMSSSQRHRSEPARVMPSIPSLTTFGHPTQSPESGAANQTNRAKHTKRTRTTNRQPQKSVSATTHICPVCSKQFTRSDMLVRHALVHTGRRPYLCKLCGHAFSRSDHLATHHRTHTGQRPYRCPLCNYSACRRDMITRHLRVHERKGQLEISGSSVLSSSVVYDPSCLTSPSRRKGRRPRQCAFVPVLKQQ